MQESPATAGAILDAALKLAAASSWEAVRLHQVATELNVTLDDIRRHYRQKDDLVEAWFDRADQAMLKAASTAEFRYLSGRQRLYTIILAWLDALAAHRDATRQMLLYKLELGHVHLQVLGVMRISRTVQWMREAASQDSTDLARIMDEIALTSIYVATFARWLADDSAGYEKTKKFLDSVLAGKDHIEKGFGWMLPGFSRTEPVSVPQREPTVAEVPERR